MSSNSSPNQRAVPENLSSNKKGNFLPVRRQIALRRRLKQLTKIEMRSVLVVAALAGVLMLGNAFAIAPSQDSAPAFFNRGNALVREGKPGPAILAYERAQQLAPRDPALADSLKAVRDTAGLAVPAPPWWQSAARVLTMNEWAWSGSLALALVCGATFLVRLLPTRLRQPLKTLSAVCALVIFVSITALLLRWPELSRAVVLNSRVSALIAPAKSAEPLFSLVEGEIVTAKKALHSFVLVQTANGRSGWVERTQIERVIPAPVPDRARS
jgi:hypothetical protein